MRIDPAEKNVFNNKRAKQGEIQITKEYRRAQRLSTILPVCIGLVALIVFSSICYLWWLQPVKTADGYMMTTGEEVVIGSTVLVTEKGGDWETRFKNIFNEQKYLTGEIFAGPYGKLKKTGNNYLVDSSSTPDTPVKISGMEYHDLYLDNEYLIQAPGTDGYTIVREEQVRGVLKQ